MRGGPRISFLRPFLEHRPAWHVNTIVDDDFSHSPRPCVSAAAALLPVEGCAGCSCRSLGEQLDQDAAGICSDFRDGVVGASGRW